MKRTAFDTLNAIASELKKQGHFFLADVIEPLGLFGGNLPLTISDVEVAAMELATDKEDDDRQRRTYRLLRWHTIANIAHAMKRDCSPVGDKLRFADILDSAPSSSNRQADAAELRVQHS